MPSRVCAFELANTVHRASATSSVKLKNNLFSGEIRYIQRRLPDDYAMMTTNQKK